jgi:FixJ family two-component response regulator
MSAAPSGFPLATVFVVDDDDASRVATARMLRASGLQASAFSGAREFIAAAPGGPGCLVLDLRMPGVDGLSLQRCINEAADPLPIVFLSGAADVARTVEAMKAGAVDFLEKPVQPRVLLDAVGRALGRDAQARQARAHRQVLQARYDRLTAREKEVFAYVISGRLNKQTSADLGTTEHTIKVHRHRVMEKLEAGSVADLVRIGADLGIAPRHGPR